MYWITTSINTIMLKLIIIHNRNRERKQKTKCGTRYHFHKSSSCGHDYITFLFCFFLFSDFMLFLSIFFVFCHFNVTHLTRHVWTPFNQFIICVFSLLEKTKTQTTKTLFVSSVLLNSQNVSFWLVRLSFTMFCFFFGNVLFFSPSQLLFYYHLRWFVNFFFSSRSIWQERTNNIWYAYHICFFTFPLSVFDRK